MGQTQQERREGLTPFEVETKVKALRANAILKRMLKKGDLPGYAREAMNYNNANGRTKGFMEGYKKATDKQTMDERIEIDKFIHNHYLHEAKNKAIAKQKKQSHDKATKKHDKNTKKTTKKHDKSTNEHDTLSINKLPTHKKREAFGDDKKAYVEYIKKRAKYATTRMKQLKKEGYTTVHDTSFAYDKAKKWLRGRNLEWFDEYEIDENTSKDELRMLLGAVDRFYNSKTKTVNGIKRVILTKRASVSNLRCLNDNQVDIFSELMGSALGRKIMNTLSSDEGVELISDISRGDIPSFNFDWSSLTEQDFGIMSNEEKRVINKVLGFEILQYKEEYKIEVSDKDRKENKMSLAELAKLHSKK